MYGNRVTEILLFPRVRVELVLNILLIFLPLISPIVSQMVFLHHFGIFN